MVRRRRTGARGRLARRRRRVADRRGVGRSPQNLRRLEGPASPRPPAPVRLPPPFGLSARRSLTATGRTGKTRFPLGPHLPYIVVSFSAYRKLRSRGTGKITGE